MSKSFTVADHTLNTAAALGIPAADITLIAKILQKYPVACFEIEAGALEKFPALRTVLPGSMARYRVRASDGLNGKELQKLGCIRIDWEHEDGKDTGPLIKTAKAAASAELYLAVKYTGAIDPGCWKQYFKIARSFNIRGIVVACRGFEDVLGLSEKLTEIRKHAPCPVAFEASNSLGLAAAQSLAALKAGIRQLSASVAGLAGCAPMEEILMAAKHLWRYDISQGREIAADFQLVLTLLGLKTPATKGLIGPDVFAHESGIHVDGVMKNPSIYEVIRPEDVGLKRKFVIGKHSGTAALKVKGLQWGITLTNEEASSLLESVREVAQLQKGPLSDQQLKELLYRTASKKEAPNEAVL